MPHWLEESSQGGLLSWRRMRQVSLDKLEPLIRPAGFLPSKSPNLHNFVHWIEHAAWRLFRLAICPGRPSSSRPALGNQRNRSGTADAILLYSGRQPVFVADAYTRRVLSRHQLIFPPRLITNSHESSFTSICRQTMPCFNEFPCLAGRGSQTLLPPERGALRGMPLGKFLPRQEDQPALKPNSDQLSAVRYQLKQGHPGHFGSC